MIRLLRRHEVPFHVISVLSAASMAAPREMFDFYVEEGIERVCFNVEESEGDHVSESFGEAAVEAAYYRFLSEFWRLSAAAPGKITFIREIEHAIRPGYSPVGRSVSQPAGRAVRHHQHGLGRQHLDLFARAARVEERGLSGLSAGEHQSRCPRRFAAAGPISPGCLRTSRPVSRCAGSAANISASAAAASRSTSSPKTAALPARETTYCRLTKMRGTDLVLDALERGGAESEEPFREGAFCAEVCG